MILKAHLYSSIFTHLLDVHKPWSQVGFTADLISTTSVEDTHTRVIINLASASDETQRKAVYRLSRYYRGKEAVGGWSSLFFICAFSSYIDVWIRRMDFSL